MSRSRIAEIKNSVGTIRKRRGVVATHLAINTWGIHDAAGTRTDLIHRGVFHADGGWDKK